MRSAAAAPIESEDRCLGAVAALRLGEGQPLGEHELAVLRLAADQLGLALAARAARADHAGALRRATLVAEAVVSCGGALTLDGSLASVVDGACEVADAPFAAVLVATPDGSLVRARAGRAASLLGADDDLLARLDEVFEPAHLARCLPLVHTDAPRLLARLQPGRRGVRGLAASRVRFAVAVPIAVGGAVVGCLLVGCDRPHPDPATFEPLVTLAASAGAALRRAYARRPALLARDARRQLDAGHDVEPGIEHGGVEALAAVHPVDLPVVREDRVVPLGAAQDVLPRPAEELVVAAAAVDGVRAARGVDDRRVGVEAVQLVVAVAAVEVVAATAADEDVRDPSRRR